MDAGDEVLSSPDASYTRLYLVLWSSQYGCAIPKPAVTLVLSHMEIIMNLDRHIRNNIVQAVMSGDHDLYCPCEGEGEQRMSSTDDNTENIERVVSS